MDSDRKIFTGLLWRDVERDSAEVHALVRVDAGYHEEDAGTLKINIFQGIFFLKLLF